MSMLALRAILNQQSAAAFDPTSISGCKLWLDASDDDSFTFSMGTRVSRWDDKSGEANHFTQPEGAWQPSRDVTLNGLAVVRKFGAPADLSFMDGPSLGLSTSAYSVFGVVRWTDSIGAGPWIALARGGLFSPALNVGGDVGGVFDGVAWWDTNHAAAEDAWYVHSVVRGSGISTAYIDGASVGTSLVTPSGAGGNVRLFSNNSDRLTNYEAAEILVYDWALDASYHDAVVAYLIDKWGL